MTAQRPALARVLEVLDSTASYAAADKALGVPHETATRWCDTLTTRDIRVTVDDEAVGVGAFFDHRQHDFRWPWRHTSPADALGALVEAALLPEHWADEGRAPRWWCEGCEGVGYAKPRSADDPDPYTGAPMWRCGVCGSSEAGRGLLAAPPSHAALCAVASLGVDTLARAEAIVAETWPRARLVWRVMGAAELNAVLRRNYETPTHGNRVAFWFACEAVGLWSQRWPEEFRFWSASDAPPEVIAMMDERRRLCPAMRALALTEDGRPTGLHLVALSEARVVLAVEAL